MDRNLRQRHPQGTGLAPPNIDEVADISTTSTPLPNARSTAAPHPLSRASSPQTPIPSDDIVGMQRQMMELLAMLTTSQVQLQQYVQDPTTRISSLSPEVHQPSRDPDVQTPDTFSGNRENLNGFLTQVQLLFDLQPRRFITDKVKISYMVAKFRGTPLNALRPYIELPESSRPEWLNDYHQFIFYMKRNYGDPDEEGTAERKLNSLVQKGSASAYFAEFQQYAAILGWPDAPLLSIAIRGLKDEIKDQLAMIGERPKTMANLIETVVRLDNRLWERAQEKRHENRGASTTGRSVVARVITDIPRAPAKSSFNESVKGPATDHIPSRGRLSEEEKQRRKDLNLCLFCGQPGHIATNCPAAGRSTPSHRQNASITPRFEQLKVSHPPK